MSKAELIAQEIKGLPQ